MGDIVGIRDDSSSHLLYAGFIYDAWGFIGEEYYRYDEIDFANLIPFRYRGYVYDNETGLYYLNSRYYDPVTSRFVNADGYVSTGTGLMGYNMFSYCNNNPVKRYDPYGQCWRAANGAWCHDNWEYLGGYERKPDPTSPVIAEPIPLEPVPEPVPTPTTEPETTYETVIESAGATSGCTMPVEGGTLKNDYPYYSGTNVTHRGTDIQGHLGANVYSVSGGKVIAVSTNIQFNSQNLSLTGNDSYGTYVKVQSGDVIMIYAHLSGVMFHLDNK